MESLGIDLKLLISQIINFGLLFIILSKLLYKPIQKLLDDRKKAVELTEENLKKSKIQLDNIEEDRKKVMVQANKKASEILAHGKDLSKKQQDEVLENAQNEAKNIISEAEKRSNQLVDEVTKIVQKRTGKMVVDVTESVLRNLDTETQHKIIQNILKKLD